MRTLLLLVLLATCLAASSAEKIVCYFSSWAVYRPGQGSFDVEDLDPFLCTHAIFGFAGLSNQTWTIEVLDPWNENCPNDDPPGGKCAFDRFVALKNINPSLKVILAVGGWNEGSEDYSYMVADPAKRKTFIDSSIALVLKHGFDGLDIDWEYPTLRGGTDADKANFITLLDEFRVEFDRLGLLMTAALASGRPTIDPAYDVAGIVRNLDIMSIMTYDYHGAWENITHHNSPLCGYPTDKDQFEYFNVVYSINYWLELGAPKEKIVMGIPTYGRCFTLDNYEEHGMLAPAGKPGRPGPYTRLPGTLGFNEICLRLKDTSDCTVVHDRLLHEPYMYCKKDKIWCGYEDLESAKEKARFAKNMGLAGVMMWTVDTDDFQPSCGAEKFALINTIKRALVQPADDNLETCPSIIPTTTTAAPTTTTTIRPTTTTAAPTTTTTIRPTTTTAAPTTTTTIRPTTTTAAPTTTTTIRPTTTTTAPTPTTTIRPTTTTAAPTPTTTIRPTTTTTAAPETTTVKPITTTVRTTNTVPVTTTTTWRPPFTTEEPTWPSKPDCDLDPDREFYPHSECNMYWRCVNGSPILFDCPPGTVFDTNLSMCNHPDDVDTSHCNLNICDVDGKLFPAAYCNAYYECDHGHGILLECAEGLYFNKNTLMCDYPVNVDTSTCNIPA